MRIRLQLVILVAIAILLPRITYSSPLNDILSTIGSFISVSGASIYRATDLVESIIDTHTNNRHHRSAKSFSGHDSNNQDSAPSNRHENDDHEDDNDNDNDDDDHYSKVDPDRDRNVAEVIESRGYEAEEHDVITRDGYILTLQRIINPLIEEGERKNLKPVIIQHGLMSSSVDFVINSVNVHPEKWPKEKKLSNDLVDDDKDYLSSVNLQNSSLRGDSQEHPNSIGFYLANRGYDVWLANSRGNIYGQRHINKTKYEPSFWSFTFDEQIEYDLPDTINYVLNETSQLKVGYIGHSQGTVIMFGLLSEKPYFADIVEPFIALAPVAYVGNCISPVRHFSKVTPFFQHINMCFAVPNPVIKYLAPIVCGPKFIKKEICANIIFLSIGFDWDELDADRISAYLGHMPSGTSVKNIAHYGQLVNSGRFAKFDHGLLGNQMRYGKTRPPDYKLDKIRSKSIALFVAENDWLASPKDVAKLRRVLKVKPHAVFNLTQDVAQWNHIDFVYGKDAGMLVNTRIEQVFKDFHEPVVESGKMEK